MPMFFLVGLQPDSFRCSSSSDMCFNAEAILTDPQPLAFGTNTDGSIDFCQSRPLTDSNDTTCQFDMSQPLQKCTLNNSGVMVEYGPSAMDTSIVTEFDLICDDAYKVNSSFSPTRSLRI